jgi:predicted DNA-binding transcriptional regulator YafY
MGRRSYAETLIAIVDAFHVQRTWSQAALAKHVGVETRTIRGQLDLLLGTERFPLERSVDGSQVYWSLPRRWIPGGASIPDADLAPLIRLLARAPKSRFRDRMIAMLLASAPPRERPALLPETIAAPPRSEHEDRMLEHAETSIARQTPLSVRYYTASRAEETTRCLSVQRIDAGPHARLIAYCHTAKALRTFRVDRIRGAALDPGVTFVRVDEEEVLAYVAQSIDGYHGPVQGPVRCAFFVRDPEARWVEHNLLEPMHASRVDGGVEVLVDTAAIEVVARFVVGLGSAAVCSTPELRDRARALAEGVLATMPPRGAP